MNKTVLFCFVLTFLIGCVSHQELDIANDEKYAEYRCLNPKHLTVISMSWNTCPLLSNKPVPHLGQSEWDLYSIVTETNKAYLELSLSNKWKLERGTKDCSRPSVVDEIIEINSENKIYVYKMNQYSGKPGHGLAFKGLVTISGKQYPVRYSSYLEKSGSVLGYDLDKYFEPCSQASNKSKQQGPAAGTR